MSMTQFLSTTPFSLTGIQSAGTINGNTPCDSITILNQTTFLSSSAVNQNTGNINLDLHIPDAGSQVQKGLLLGTDWDTFNNKQNGITASAPLDFSSNIISIRQSSTSQDGYLSSTDWNTFNDKAGLGLNNVFTNTNQFNSNFNIISPNIAFTNLGTTAETHFLAINNNNGLLTKNPISGLSILGTTNVFTGASNTFINYVYFDNSNTFGCYMPFGNVLRIGHNNGLFSPPSTNAYMDFNDTGGSAIYGLGMTIVPITTFTNYLYFNSGNTFGAYMPFGNVLRIGFNNGLASPPLTNAFMDFNDGGGSAVYGTGMTINPATLFSNNITIANDKTIKFNDTVKTNKLILYGNDDNNAYSIGIASSTILYNAGTGNQHSFFTSSRVYNPLIISDAGGNFQQEGRTGSHGTPRGLYVSGTWGQLDTGAEFRHTNGTQGVGIGFGGLYATGTNPSQDLAFKSRGSGQLNFFNDTSLSLSILSGSFQIRTNASLISYLDNITQYWLETNGDVMMYIIRNGYTDLKWVVHRTPTSYAFYNTLSNTLGTVSDERTKKDIKPIDINKSKEFILSITPSTYRFRDGNTEVKNIGFIAQDILKNAKTEAQKNIVSNWKIYEEQNGDPYQAHEDASGNITMKKAYLGVSQMSILPEVCGCLQQMEKENQELKAEVELLKEKNILLEERLLKIERLLDLS